jgi:hypothetical protein
MKPQTFQLPENTIKLLEKYAKKENKNGRKSTKQGIVNEAILEKVTTKK